MPFFSFLRIHYHPPATAWHTHIDTPTQKKNILLEKPFLDTSITRFYGKARNTFSSISGKGFLNFTFILGNLTFHGLQVWTLKGLPALSYDIGRSSVEFPSIEFDIVQIWALMWYRPKVWFELRVSSFNSIHSYFVLVLPRFLWHCNVWYEFCILTVSQKLPPCSKTPFLPKKIILLRFKSRGSVCFGSELDMKTIFPCPVIVSMVE